ncbi:MAG: type II toxin-antitoxin system VapC family toxin [Deltaproteobacteria bacterium]|nr:type II toxin-antitoxin system VapC family toxin [Deltaproteobacteria bacterium]
MKTLVIDSSGWLEYFIGGRHAKTYLKHIESAKAIWLPAIVLYEVYKKFAQEKSESEGLLAITQMEQQSKGVVVLDERLALFAADTSLRHKLPMADAIIYATALEKEAVLLTSDRHFKGLKNVVLI